MPYYVVWGCKSDSSTDTTFSWFSFPHVSGFPKDQPRLKAWVHYCKRQNFTPSKYVVKYVESISQRASIVGIQQDWPSLDILEQDRHWRMMLFLIFPLKWMTILLPTKKPRKTFQKKRKNEVFMTRHNKLQFK